MTPITSNSVTYFFGGSDTTPNISITVSFCDQTIKFSTYYGALEIDEATAIARYIHNLIELKNQSKNADSDDSESVTTN